MLTLDGQGPLYRQLYHALRSAILRGELGPGERLAATRLLAQDLNISRNVVMLAYEQLLAEGYLSARVGAGTFVAEALPDTPFQSVEKSEQLSDQDTPPRVSAYAQRLQLDLPERSWLLR